MAFYSFNPKSSGNIFSYLSFVHAVPNANIVVPVWNLLTRLIQWPSIMYIFRQSFSLSLPHSPSFFSLSFSLSKRDFVFIAAKASIAGRCCSSVNPLQHRFRRSKRKRRTNGWLTCKRNNRSITIRSLFPSSSFSTREHKEC